MKILCVHDVVAFPRASCPWAVTEREINTILTRHCERDFLLATLDDLPHAQERSIAMTVDDGRAGAVSWLLHTAPTLGVAATIFVVPGWIDNAAMIPTAERYSEFGTWEQVAELLDVGHSIGSHGLTHVRLPNLSEDGITCELRQSRARIRAQVGIDVRHFAAPYGHINSMVVSSAWDAGYATIGSTVPGFNGRAERRSGVLKRFVLRRDRPSLGLPLCEVDR